MGKIFRIIGAVAAALLVLLGAAVVVAPYAHPLINWRVVLLVVAGLCVVGGRKALTKPSKGILLPVIVGICVLPPMLVTAGFAKFDIFAVIHHLKFGMMDADMGIVIRSLAPLIAALCVFVFGLYWIKSAFRLGDKIYWYGAILIGTINPLTISLFEMATTPSYDSDLSQRIAAPEITAPQTPADVVIVYLEGLDRSFADRNRFGDIYAPLEALEQDAVTLTGVRQIQGTSWSLAGLVASQCGLPLVPNGLRNFYSFEAQTAFLTDHDCLSDVLAERGYRNSFVVGSAVGFAGQRHFLESHQFDFMLGKHEMLEMKDPSVTVPATAARIFDDQLVFDVALDTYATQVQDPEPLALIIETYGPHGDSGTLARNCTEDGQAIETGDLPATVTCTLSNMEIFLDGIEALRAGRPTLVVLMSDHLNHAWRKERNSDEGGRANTVMMLGLDMPDVPRGLIIDRAASMIDVYPTMLALLGLSDADARAGLGVSLLGTSPTLVEEKGFVRLNHELTRNYELSRAVWGEQ